MFRMILRRELNSRGIIASIQKGMSALILRTMLRLRHGAVSEGGRGGSRETVTNRTEMPYRICVP